MAKPLLYRQSRRPDPPIIQARRPGCPPLGYWSTDYGRGIGVKQCGQLTRGNIARFPPFGTDFVATQLHIRRDEPNKLLRSPERFEPVLNVNTTVSAHQH
jgi:hypothetical protein